MKHTRKILLGSLLALGICGTANAGPYADDLGKCLVRASTDADKQELMAWIFSAIALNPRIAPHANITAAKRDQLDRNMAAVFTRLVGESCQKQASEALKYEGGSAFGTAFQLLGQVAGQQLFQSPEVMAGSSAFIKHVDLDGLQKKLGVDGGTP